MKDRTVEEYVESIGSLEQLESPVSTSSVARLLDLTLASVSEMLRKLAEKGLVEYEPYQGATLTEEGRQHFLRLTRRHRLWEVFLSRHLGMGWEEVYEEACNLEHATSDTVADKLAEFLERPEVCPHGCPIPLNGQGYCEIQGRQLSDLDVGSTGKVVQIINERDAEFLRYLEELGLVPGAKVVIVDKASFDGTLTIKVGGSTRALGQEAAGLIMVEPM